MAGPIRPANMQEYRVLQAEIDKETKLFTSGSGNAGGNLDTMVDILAGQFEQTSMARTQQTGLGNEGSLVDEGLFYEQMAGSGFSPVTAETNVDGILKKASIPGIPGIPGAVGNPYPGMSNNQIKAMKKYPALIEMLGSDNSLGDQIASDILVKLNEHIVEGLQKNAQSISKDALICESDEHNFKQYFGGIDEETNMKWGCVVLASGPFRGDEAIHFSQQHKQAKIYRLVDTPDRLHLDDVTSQFNVIPQYAEEELKVEEHEEKQEVTAS